LNRFFEKVTFEQRFANRGKSILAGENSRYKGPEVIAWLEYLRNSKERRVRGKRRWRGGQRDNGAD
jgi:hypothetical protein